MVAELNNEKCESEEKFFVSEIKFALRNLNFECGISSATNCLLNTDSFLM